MSPHVELIDAELSHAGANHALVGRRYGVQRLALGRHLKGGHVRPPQEGEKVAEVSAEADVDPRETLQKALNALAAQDMTAMSARERTDTTETIRRTADTLHKISPPNAAASAAEQELEGYRERSRAVATALESFPEAREAVERALRELRGAA